MKDWSGNSVSVYSILGSSSHSEKEREQNDYYATNPKAVSFLLENETFSDNIWEPACGENHIANILKENGYNVICSDIIKRTDSNNFRKIDFLKVPEYNHKNEPIICDCDIVTNPPYKYAQEFVEKSLKLVGPGHKVAMYLKLTFLEGQKRQRLFEQHNLKTVYVSAKRMACGKNGNFFKEGTDKIDQGAVAYAWFVWEKDYHGDPVIKWINT